MRFSVTRLACNSLILGGLLSPVVAETSQERVALSLSGPDCVSQRPSIVAALVRIPGVNHVDVESVPDHALVDVVQPGAAPNILPARRRTTRAASVRSRVAGPGRRTAPGSRCRGRFAAMMSARVMTGRRPGPGSSAGLGVSLIEGSRVRSVMGHDHKRRFNAHLSIRLSFIG